MDIDKIVKDKLGIDSYIKGKNYNEYYLRYLGSRAFLNDEKLDVFDVESESTNNYYDVYIFTKNDLLTNATCNCPQYKRTRTCKHIAACLLNFNNVIFKKVPDKFEVSDEILKLFYSEKKDKKSVKEALTLDLELEFDDDSVIVKPSVGLKKTYVINNETKFNDFMDAYKNGGKYYFGTNFEFDSEKHYLSKEDEEILEFLYGFKKHQYYYSYYSKSNIFELNEREFKILLDKIKNRSFKIKGHSKVKGISFDMPTSLDLDVKDGNYNLSVEDLDNYKFLDDNFKYVLYKQMLYVLPGNYSKMLKEMKEHRVSNLVFKKDNMETFKNGLLRKVKNNINLSDNVTDIVISSKPDIALYFDLLREKIDCKVKLNYDGNEIDYFEDNTKIIRDDEEEEKVINELLDYNFKINKNKITLDALDDIGYFVSEGISNLAESYKIYTSKKIDNMNVIKKSIVKSNFSIGQDGIMSYDFNVDNINLDELDDVLSSLKSKKRYYKLKNGNLINLEENKDLQELNNIFDDLALSSKDIEEGTASIPKYRAFYIDSLKNNKYKNISTDYSFDNFIKNFKKYKDLKIEFDENDSKTLREYQKEGVKWLYTLYKCDLGGILADEMGLGKSLQTISFIKQILKDKKDAKIMIVCPTSLVYNWKKEFDKFAPELKYVAVADNKAKRVEIINDFDKYNIFITSYGLIRNDNDEYEKIDFELCVIDEAQAIKNYQAGMTREVKKIKARTKIALTGTPLENSVLELWSIFDFIMPGYLNSIVKFKESYGIKDVDEESLEKLKDLNYQIKPFILRRKR